MPSTFQTGAWLFVWLFDWSIDRLIDWLKDWFSKTLKEMPNLKKLLVPWTSNEQAVYNVIDLEHSLGQGIYLGFNDWLRNDSTQHIFIPFYCRFQCVISSLQCQLTVLKFKPHRGKAKQQLINILKWTKYTTYIGILMSWTLNFSNLQITWTKSCFPSLVE